MIRETDIESQPRHHRFMFEKWSGLRQWRLHRHATQIDKWSGRPSHETPVDQSTFPHLLAQATSPPLARDTNPITTITISIIIIIICTSTITSIIANYHYYYPQSTSSPGEFPPA